MIKCSEVLKPLLVVPPSPLAVGCTLKRLTDVSDMLCGFCCLGNSYFKCMHYKRQNTYLVGSYPEKNPEASQACGFGFYIGGSWQFLISAGVEDRVEEGQTCGL